LNSFEKSVQLRHILDVVDCLIMKSNPVVNDINATLEMVTKRDTGHFIIPQSHDLEHFKQYICNISQTCNISAYAALMRFCGLEKINETISEQFRGP
jgi:hypothetical protein